MGRRPNPEKVLSATKRTLWDILLNDCKDCKCVADANQVIAKLGVTLSDGGLYKNIKDGVNSGDIPNDSPVASWSLKISTGKRGGRGRVSFTTVVKDKTGRTLWSILKKECKACTSIFESVTVLDGMELNISPGGLLGLIKRSVESGELTGKEHFSQWNMSKTGSGKKGKKSFTSLVQEHFGVSLIKLLRDKCSQCDSASEAIAAINNLSKGKVSTSENTLVRSIEKENEDVKVSDFFRSWIPSHRVKKGKTEDVKITAKDEEDRNGEITKRVKAQYEEAFGSDGPLKITCSECGDVRMGQIMEIEKGKMGYRAIRCPKCHRCTTFIVSGQNMVSQRVAAIPYTK